MSGEAQVYVPDPNAAWARASVLRSLGGSKYEVRIDGIDDNEEPRQGTRGAGEIRHVNLEGKEFRGNTGGGGAEKTLPLQNLSMLPHGVDDMTRLNYLHEPAILFNLRRRFFRELPYTYTGEIVIACNPYRWLNIYGEERGLQYAGMVRGDRSRLPPHVYSTSAVAFSGLTSKNENQSILVSGESGAGKTETVKILMGHLAVASKAVDDGKREGLGGGVDGGEGGRSRGNEGVILKIIESNPLLESFGNAKTTRNDNSSRFGKFTQLQFDRWFRMTGSECTTYLLEKSRVVGHGPDERGYHIFYQILAAPEDSKAALGLSGKHASDFRYLTADASEGDCVIEGRTDAQRYEMTTAALGLIGVTAEETMALLRALAGIAYLGQVDFRVRGSDEDTSEVVDRDTLRPPSELLGLSGDDVDDEGLGAALESSLCYRLIRARNDVVRADSNPAQAVEARDAMAKAVYGRLFDWLVRRINQGTAASPLLSSAGEFAVGDAAGSGLGTYPPPRRRAAAEGPAPGGSGGGTVALLDIFGFESFQVNRFEQLCINYANEKLQQKFTQDVFKTVQIEYEEEGIPWTHVDFSDNAGVLALVESRMGIIAVLNEECLRPRGNDLSLVNKLVTLHSDHPSFARAKLARQFEFSVRHYAGEVLYDTEGFLEKNRDSVGQACLDLLAKSRVPLLASVFAPEKAAADGDRRRDGRNQRGGGGAPQRKNPKAASTLATKFRDSLASLMDTIGRTSVQYVRCIKPNAAKVPGLMENKKVVEQLRCAGVIEAIRISRAAYPNRMTRKEFNKRFALLDKHAAGRARGMDESLWRGEAEPEAEVARCKSLLAQLLPREGGDDAPLRYELGRTKVYFRAGALEHLEALRLSERSRRATVLQAVCRMWSRRVYFCALREGTLRAQTVWRRILQRRRFLLDRRRIIMVQSCWRRVQAEKVVLTMRRHRAAACLQSYRRMFVARRSFLSMKDAAVRIQTFLRGARARRAYAVMVVEHREAAKLENQIAALQRKLDEEQQARRKMEEQLARKALTPDDPRVVAPAPPATVTSRFAEEAVSAAARAGGDGVVARAGLPLAGDREATMMRDFLLGGRGAEGGLVEGEDGRRGPRLDIMGESSEIIATLKSERDKLRRDNDHLKEANESLRRERQQEKQRALSSYEASGMSYHALNQNLKALSARNQKLVAELKQARETSESEHATMLEILQTKAEELLRREEEGKTMRLLYESEVTKGKHKLRAMVTMMRLVAETITPMYAPEKDELGLQLNAIYRECLVEDPVVVGEVDRMMSRPLFERSSSVFSSAKGMVSNLFGSKKRTSL